MVTQVPVVVASVLVDGVVEVVPVVLEDPDLVELVVLVVLDRHSQYSQHQFVNL
jgi:hypothetical protein